MPLLWSWQTFSDANSFWEYLLFLSFTFTFSLLLAHVLFLFLFSLSLQVRFLYNCPIKVFFFFFGLSFKCIEVLFWWRLRRGLKRVVLLFGEASPRALVGELGFWFFTDLRKSASLDVLLAWRPLKGWICDQIFDHMYVSCVFVCMLVLFEFFVILVWTAIDGAFTILFFLSYK